MKADKLMPKCCNDGGWRSRAIDYVFFCVTDGGSYMAQEAHLLQLTQKHASLELAISDENQRPVPDAMRLAELKRLKLRIKDEIAKLNHSH